MIRGLFASAAVLLMAGNASAADIYGAATTPEYVAAPAFDWSGLYFGAYGALGSQTTNAATSLLAPDGSLYFPNHPDHNTFNGSGALAGVQAGYNFQTSGGLVLGVEGDVAWTNMSGSFNFDPLRPEAVAGNNTNWLATLRGRAGFTVNRALFYGTAGLAMVDFRGYANNVWLVAPAVDVAEDKGIVAGWTVGGGAEFAMTDNVSVKAEYLYARFDRSRHMSSPAFTPGATMLTESKLHTHVVKLGLNYRFR